MPEAILHIRVLKATGYPHAIMELADKKPDWSLSEVELTAMAGSLLMHLWNHEHAWVFDTPVDPVELGLPDYFDVVKKPMDLGTIMRRLLSRHYDTIEGFQADVLLTFDNAMLYNEEGSIVHNMAKELKTMFISDYNKLTNEQQ